MWTKRPLAILLTMATASASAQTTIPTTSPAVPPTSTVQSPPATAPATAPASQPVLPAEPATPKDALKIFAAAMRDGDAERLKSVVVTDNPAEVRMLGAMAGLAGALARLNQSAVKAFGEEDASRFTDDNSAHFAETLARIDAAEVTVEGDKAIVRYRGPGQTAFEMHRSPTIRAGQEGEWKVPMSELSPGADPAALDQRLEELNVQRKIVDELAEEIGAGKYKNAEAGREAWRGKIMQTLPSRPPGAPATRTASQ